MAPPGIPVEAPIKPGTPPADLSSERTTSPLFPATKSSAPAGAPRLHGDLPKAAAAAAAAPVPSLAEIKAVIPAHCFKPSLARSMAYVAQDAAIIGGLYALAWAFANVDGLKKFNAAFLPAFWFFQGFMFWAVFVLGHDCGHGSFSRYPAINAFMGHLLHSAILVPFHSWRISHRTHHKNTGNYEKDQIFHPYTESTPRSKTASIVADELYFVLPLAYPLYLLSGYARPSNHLNPNDEYLFTDSERPLIRTSAACWYAMLALLGGLAIKFGLGFVVKYYFVPYFVYCAWLALVTFLHHTRPGTKWYNTKNWNYVKGNLESIDRVYGWFEYFHHDIGTHVVHHLFPAIPHYHLREANAAVKPMLGDLHNKSEEDIVESFFVSYDAWRKSNVIPDDTDVFVIPPVEKAAKKQD